VDFFDCVLPTRVARNGALLTWDGRLNMRNLQHAEDHSPVEEECTCYTCRTFSRAYLRHLYKAGEISALRLGTIHNVHFMLELMRRIREALHDEYYSAIGGVTDSEHIFALFLNFLHAQPVTIQTMSDALRATIQQLNAWTEPQRLHVALNLAVTNGECLIVSRFSSSVPAPSLYYQQRSAMFPDAVVVASERLSQHVQWSAVPENCLVAFTADLHMQMAPLTVS
jgi:hypothetical protein